MRTVITILIAALLLALGSSSLYTVDRAEFVYVTQFGRHVLTHDGASDGGLHFKAPWPVQSVQRLDRRLQHFDLPETELLTHDLEGQTIDKTLSVVAYVCWRIADADSADLFIRRMGTTDRARAILGDRVRSQLGALISQMRMTDLISTDAAKVTENLEDLRKRLLLGHGTGRPGTPEAASLSELARTEYGIEIVDVRLRRTGYPVAVRDAIFDRIRSERNKKVAEHQSEGTRQAEDIKSRAEAEAREIVARARAAEQQIRGEAEARADRIRNEAHGKDVEFYAFLKKLEEYQRILGDNKTMLLLSSHGELFDVLFKPPKPNGSGTAVKETPKPGGP